ncbi:MAG: hypothetical protein ABL901_09110 [Hyphomicrobiaceae bacterium]
MHFTVDITDHALRRYVERVLQLDLNWPLKRGYSEWRAVNWAADTHGIDLQGLRREIAREVRSMLPDTVRLRGSRAVLRGIKCRYVIERGNVVMTVFDEAMKDSRDAARAIREFAQ